MLTSHELFGFMSPALANDILNFAYESDKPVYKATMNGVATALRVRPFIWSASRARNGTFRWLKSCRVRVLTPFPAD